MKVQRPAITEFTQPEEFLAAQSRYLKKTVPGYSVLKMVRKTPNCSAALISLILKGKRRIHVDRLGDLGAIFMLSSREKIFLRDWVTSKNYASATGGSSGHQHADVEEAVPTQKRRRATSAADFLKDWLHVYIKDSFRIASVRHEPERVFSLLGGIATRKRILKGIQFLLDAGYLKKLPSGSIKEDTPLIVADDEIPSERVRSFHRASLRIASEALGLYSIDKRIANALVLALDEKGYNEMKGLIDEFNEKLQAFAEKKSSGDRLYQLIIHLSPTGGEHEND